MSERASFVYVTYIATTADKLWRALTDGELTREYWGGRRIESDWKAGSTFLLRKLDGTVDGAHGTVVEATAPARLVLTWQSGAAPPSRVSFTISAASPENVRLQV